MPRVGENAKNKKNVARKKNGYASPQKIPLGEILTDLSKISWKIGPSIGIGGFGEIYSACKADKAPKKTEDYEYVVKIEPHENGPLFVEMHFYMRNAKLDDIKNFMKNNGLKSIGMPYFLGSGSHELNDIKHRFLVMPRYSKDIWSYFLNNGKRLPEHTIYRLAIQMLDVYQYIHGCTYVHGDLKGANILLGFGKSGAQQAFLVDYGLASHYTTKDFKPDNKKMHNGTIEYTSRDAHQGVPTMRGDIEILGYNLIHWSGSMLPWETNKLLAFPVKVQKSKEEFMANVSSSLKQLYGNCVPDPILQFMIYVAKLKFDEEPNYEKCRKIFQNGLKLLGKNNSGNLELQIDKDVGPSTVKSTPLKKIKLDKNISQNKDDVIEVSPEIQKRRIPISRAAKSPTKRKLDGSLRKSESPKKMKQNSPNPSTRSPRSSKVSLHKSYGKTVINDNLTPNPSSKKTYEFNFDLDVSVDANVVVNVRRKKKSKEDATLNTPEPRVHIRRIPTKSPKGGAATLDTPEPRVRIRRIPSKSPRGGAK